jgi:hypothetical protein
MPDPRDPVDAWLEAGVQPLAPLPGSYDRIRRQARRRKTGRALIGAAGAAVVIAAAVAAPSVASGLHGNAVSRLRPTAQGTNASLPRHQGAGSPNSQSSAQVPPLSSSLSATGSGIAVPPNFQPTSVTFVGTSIGAVIGQAGSPGHCATRYCTSLAGTFNYGQSWYGVSAPVTGSPEGSFGVSQIRFLDVRNGWAFGPALWVTHDGGASWTQENTFGQRVVDLEASGDRAFALLATCTGTGPAYAAGCTGFSLYSSPADSDQWTQVTGPTASLPTPAGQAGSASLVLAAGRGYLLAPSGQLLSGLLTGAAWTVASPSVPCAPGPPGPGGQPTDALLGADPAGLVLVCSTSEATGDSQQKTVEESADGGQQWSVAGYPPVTGIAESLAAEPGGQLVLATDAGIYCSGPGGSTWQLAQASPADSAAGEAGFSYVGMTSAQNGVALPADSGLHEVFTTTDGGDTWQAHAVSGP